MSAQVKTFLCRSDNIGVLIHDSETGACAAIDVPEAGPVLRALDETGWRLTDILVTHRHGDHIAGIPEVKEKTGARVTAPRKAGGEIPGVDVAVGEGDTVSVGSLTAQVWETPGHCSDHITYWFEQAGSSARGTRCSPSAAAASSKARRKCCGVRFNGFRRCRTRPKSSAGMTTYCRTASSPSPPTRTTRPCAPVSRKPSKPSARAAS